MKIKIPQPKVLLQDEVFVLNYRRVSKANPNGVWEKGKIAEVEYKLWKKTEGRWHYSVRLNRLSPPKIGWRDMDYGSNPIFVYVGDEGLRKVS